MYELQVALIKESLPMIFIAYEGRSQSGLSLPLCLFQLIPTNLWRQQKLCVHSTVGGMSGGGSSFRSRSAGNASGTTSSNLLCCSPLCALSFRVAGSVEAIDIDTGRGGRGGSKNRSGSCTESSGRLPWRAPHYRPTSAVLSLLNIKTYNLHW